MHFAKNPINTSSAVNPFFVPLKEASRRFSQIYSSPFDQVRGQVLQHIRTARSTAIAKIFDGRFNYSE